MSDVKTGGVLHVTCSAPPGFSRHLGTGKAETA